MRTFTWLSFADLSCSALARCRSRCQRRRIGSRPGRDWASRKRGSPCPTRWRVRPLAPPLPKTFHDVVWADLDYSGILDLVSPSFYPAAGARPAERTEGAGLGRGASERVHGGLRQSCHGRYRAWRSPDISPTYAIRRRRSRCRKFIAARPPTRTSRAWRTSSRTTSSAC